MSGPVRRSPVAEVKRITKRTTHAWRMATADLRTMPGVIIIGAQRSGTTSLHSWLCAHPEVAPQLVKEVHYFDGDDARYGRGERFYRSRFPITSRAKTHVEASPYMLFHPLAPQRAAHDLPKETRFVVMLREPGERALSHYQFQLRRKRESETFARALELEESRLEGVDDLVRRGGKSDPHRWYSYRSRGRYAGQLSRWFDAVGRERILIMESERMFTTAEGPGEVLSFIGLAPFSMPFPTLNATTSPNADDAATRDQLRESFGTDNDVLFDLLGRKLWTEQSD